MFNTNLFNDSVIATNYDKTIFEDPGIGNRCSAPLTAILNL
jgi:hypothetical protein